MFLLICPVEGFHMFIAIEAMPLLASSPVLSKAARQKINFPEFRIFKVWPVVWVPGSDCFVNRPTRYVAVEQNRDRSHQISVSSERPYQSVGRQIPESESCVCRATHNMIHATATFDRIKVNFAYKTIILVKRNKCLFYLFVIAVTKHFFFNQKCVLVRTTLI